VASGFFTMPLCAASARVAFENRLGTITETAALQQTETGGTSLFALKAVPGLSDPSAARNFPGQGVMIYNLLSILL
jgi:hypothetical protein